MQLSFLPYGHKEDEETGPASCYAGQLRFGIWELSRWRTARLLGSIESISGEESISAASAPAWWEMVYRGGM
jgi:hypothetical protein